MRETLAEGVFSDGAEEGKRENFGGIERRSEMVIREMIRKFIQENFILGEGGPLGDEDSLLDKGVIDSTGVLELVAFIEEKYGIPVEDDELIPENLDSIRNIAEFIRRKTKSLSHNEVEHRVAP